MVRQRRAADWLLLALALALFNYADSCPVELGSDGACRMPGSLLGQHLNEERSAALKRLVETGRVIEREGDGDMYFWLAQLACP